MILIENFAQVTAQIESERGIDKEKITSAIEKALISAAKRKYSNELNVKSEIDRDTGEARLWIEKEVVESISDDEEPENQIVLSEATELDEDSEIGDIIEFDLELDDFGRIAAQTAKQVILQCIREAEKDLVMNEFSDKIGQIVTGTIQNIEGNTYLVNLGRVEAFLPPYEQVKGEQFNVNDRIRVYVSDIQKTGRGPVIKISRTHTGLVKELFKLEVPEIQDKIIEIKAVSRDPGKRTKIAVKTNNPTIGAVGTCVGHMGGRIQAILRELNNEKIDILEWDEKPEVFIGNSLKPATVSNVIIDNEEKREATIVVPDDQLSLAIGKGGQNVRLAVKLTNWKLDILSDSESNKTTQTNDKSLADKIKNDIQKESSEEKSTVTEATETEARETEATEIETNETTVSEIEVTETTETEIAKTESNETTISEIKDTETETEAAEVNIVDNVSESEDTQKES